MSQQAAAGRGAGRGGGRKPRYFPRKGGGSFTATMKAMRDWETVQATQSLDELIRRIEELCPCAFVDS